MPLRWNGTRRWTQCEVWGRFKAIHVLIVQPNVPGVDIQKISVHTMETAGTLAQRCTARAAFRPDQEFLIPFKQSGLRLAQRTAPRVTPDWLSAVSDLAARERTLPWLEKMTKNKKSAKSPNKQLMQRWPYNPLPVLLCRKQVAAILGTSTRTISRAWECGDLLRVQEAGTKGPKGYRIPLSSLEDYGRKNGFTFPWMEEDAA
jgi:hypothetical protein